MGANRQTLSTKRPRSCLISTSCLSTASSETSKSGRSFLKLDLVITKSYPFLVFDPSLRSTDNCLVNRTFLFFGNKLFFGYLIILDVCQLVVTISVFIRKGFY